MKIILRSFLVLLLLVTIILSYLSIFGVETEKFNSQIYNKISNIDEKLELELKKIKLVLNPFQFQLNIKTVGTNIKKQNKKIEIESIKAQISLKSLFENKFSIKNLEISTKSLEIKNLISFLRSYQNSPELFILEKTVDKGYLIADIKLEFDNEGKIKKNYEIDGFIKDAKLSILKKYNIQKLGLIFNYKKDNLLLSDLSFSLNKLSFLSKKISFKKIKNNFFVDGKINNKTLDVGKNNLDLFIKPFLSKYNIKTFKFNSNNSFSFQANKKFELHNLEIVSEMLIEELSVINNLNLKSFFPNSNEDILFLDNKILIKYKKNNLDINGEGDVLYQDKKDNLNYIINKKDGSLNFKSSLEIKSNPFIIDFLNYKNSEDDKTLILLEGSQNKKNITLIKSFSLIEDKNKIEVKNLIFNEKFEIIELDSVNLNYIDKDKEKNLINFFKRKNTYYLEGPYFNANKLIDNLLFDESDNSKIFNHNSNIVININKIKLDNEYYLLNFAGDISYQNKEVIKANLIGNFSDDKKFKFTINTNQDNKTTTLYIDKAEPIVRRYKFIKGFDEGLLDFYSSKKFDETDSTLKIYDFKLKELPALTKILTLASLQGIADILSGEGIRFNEFEMNFKNKGNLMTIEEIYAIGPAISILMDGYVEKNKLISLRGTLVPATTINKFIGSLPVLGKILVGSKTGEGVFGVSFKIKGPPKKLETSVNPIKTLTPRFITRTMEKIKKN